MSLGSGVSSREYQRCRKDEKNNEKQIFKKSRASADATLSLRSDREDQMRSVVGGIIALDVGFSRLPQPPVMGYKVAGLQRGGNGFCCFLARGAIRQ